MKYKELTHLSANQEVSLVIVELAEVSPGLFSDQILEDYENDLENYQKEKKILFEKQEE